MTGKTHPDESEPGAWDMLDVSFAHIWLPKNPSGSWVVLDVRSGSSAKSSEREITHRRPIRKYRTYSTRGKSSENYAERTSKQTLGSMEQVVGVDSIQAQNLSTIGPLCAGQ